jgi:hypothetical protein
MIRHLFALCAVLGLASSSHADTQWTLTTADFATRPITLQSIDDAGVHILAPQGETKLIPFDKFLDLTRPVIGAQPAGKFVLHLLSGDALGGEPVAIKGNDLIWKHPILGDVSVPMKQLLAMSRPGVALPEGNRREDVVTLANGDTLRGIVSDFADDRVTVQGDGGNNNSIPVAAISLLSFASTAGSTTAAPGFRVRFDDGSIVVTSLKVAGDKLDLSLGKTAPRSVDLSRVAAIEQVNGPVSWLSSRPAVESVYIPFFGPPQTSAAKMDHNWTGQDPIRFEAQEFAHGIGVHSYSKLSWDLDGTYAAFRTRYAIDTKDANTQADVTIRILLDGKPVYEQAHVRAGTLSPVVVEKLAGAKKLTLEVDYGDNMDTQDRVNWIEPALVKDATK